MVSKLTKESKSLYKTIKDNLNDTGSETIKESFETTVEKTPSNGSTNLMKIKHMRILGL